MVSSVGSSSAVTDMLAQMQMASDNDATQIMDDFLAQQNDESQISAAQNDGTANFQIETNPSSQ